MKGVISAAGAAEWLRVSRLELLTSHDAAVFLRLSLPGFYAGPAKVLPVVRPAGHRGSAHYLIEDLRAYLLSTRSTSTTSTSSAAA